MAQGGEGGAESAEEGEERARRGIKSGLLLLLLLPFRVLVVGAGYEELQVCD